MRVGCSKRSHFRNCRFHGSANEAIYRALSATEVVNTLTTSLKRMRNKGGSKPKRVSLEGISNTVDVEKKFTAVVRVNAETCEIKECNVQPKK